MQQSGGLSAESCLRRAGVGALRPAFELRKGKSSKNRARAHRTRIHHHPVEKLTTPGSENGTSNHP